MTAALGAFLLSVFVRVSPYVLAQLKPILVDASDRVWKSAYPLAQMIVKDLMDPKLLIDGLDRHKLAVQNLEAALVATGKFELGQISKLHLGQIVLAAFANTLANTPATPIV